MKSVPNTTDEHLLLAQAAEWLHSHSRGELSAENLQQIASKKGLDFATALLYQQVCSAPANRDFLARVMQADAERPRRRSPGFRVAIVPGAFHREHRHSGADGRLLVKELKKLGYQADVISLPSFGRLAEGAAQLRDWLIDQTEPLALVSLSKGGTEVKLALAGPNSGQAFRHVVGWVNLSGILEGTALVDWLYRQRLRYLAVRWMLWWRGHAIGALEDLRRGGALLDPPLKLPLGLTAIHVVGFPLRRHLSCRWAQRGYRRLEPLGPNDGGGILLADAASRPGAVYPVWGVDHYLRLGSGLRPLLGRLLRYVEQEASCSATSA